MSKHGSNLDLPGLSADESGGNLTDASSMDRVPLQQQQQQQQQKNYPTSAAPFIDSNFFYNLDQLDSENPLFFMQQQNGHQQTQSNQSTMYGDQFLKEQQQGEGSSSTNTLSQSVAASLASFQAAVTSSVGEQPPSFWTGLNNFISNVTHTNLFPTFPNIARSFSDYIASHQVPFLSSFNQVAASPASSPMPSNSDYDPIMRFKQEHEQSNSGLQIRVLGVPQTGAKSRVETQIKLCIQLVTDGGDKAQWWSHLKLPEHMVTKDKLKKTNNSRNGGGLSDSGLPVNPEKMLYLQARVLCASDPSKKVVTCIGCIQRERKRSQRRKENKQQQQQQNEDTEDEKSIEEDNQSLTSDEERILLFNCSEVVDFSAGDTILPTRITCYCRHHNERLGFCIYFEMVDYNGNKVAEGISPPIMITDDHKSSKVKSGLKRRRTTENDALAPPPTPHNNHQSTPTDSLTALNWIKSFQFSNPIKTENQYQPLTTPSATATAAAVTANDESMKFKNMLSSAQSMLFAQPPPPPTMKRLIPNEAAASGGIEVTILGNDFKPGMTVMFGDVPATNIQYWSSNTLVCTLPPTTNPGTVVVSFKEAPPTTNKNDVMLFTYLVETDRALMELALQVVGMKTTGIVEDARKIAMRIVQGNGPNHQNFSDKLAIKSEPSSSSLN